MGMTLDYAGPRARRRYDWLGILALLLGSVLLAMGLPLAVFTWRGLRETNLPNYSWGPGQYMIAIHETLVWLTIIVCGASVPFVLVGVRRLRASLRGAASGT
jgi:CO dehydrogenase/acetyl-CoA synthase delta subunit